MELYLIIALIKHSKKEDFGGLLGVHLMLILDRGPCSPEVSKPKAIVLWIALVCIEEGICILYSCLTVMSLRIIPR